MRAAMLGACLALLLAGVSAQERSLLDTTATQQTSIPWVSTYLDPSAPLPIDSVYTARNVSGLDPEQIHITYVSPTEVVISWATGVASDNALPLSSGYTGNDGTASDVFIGTASDSYTLNFTGYTTGYNQIYTKLNGSWPLLNYSSPVLHHTPVTGLTPNTTYYYVCGDPVLGLSQEFNFTSGPSAEQPFPFRLGLIADLGETINSTVTIQHLQASNPQIFTLIGDLTYADDVSTNGTTTTSNGTVAKYPSPSPAGTYQPRWDGWYRFMQSLMATTPFIPQHGNHELEPQGNASYASGLHPTTQFPNGSQFQSYIHRNPVPYQQSGSDNPLWYSVNLGGIHFVQLSNYANFAVGSDQYEWLVNDLATFNRTATPWLIATWHAPWYSSYTTHYAENQCMRQAMEDVLFDAGVDMVFNGHLHTYERSYPTYNYTVNPCGPVYVTIGDGGNIEGLYKLFVQQGTANCPKPGTIPAYQPGGYCPSASFPYEDAAGNGGQYCPLGQPEWSAFRQPIFGHATIDFINSTAALYQFNRNTDSTSVIADSVYILRDLTCPNKAGYPGATAQAPSITHNVPNPTVVSTAGK